MKKRVREIEKCGMSSMAERINFLCDNYNVMEPMISNYRERLITEVMEQKAKSHRGENEGLCVRIQVAFCNRNDPTANGAMSRMRVAQAIDEGYLDEDFFEGTEDREELISKVTSYHVVNASYRVFTEKLKELEQGERSVMMSYLRKEKTLDELAGELSIDYESICKKIWRIKRKIGKGMSVIMA